MDLSVKSIKLSIIDIDSVMWVKIIKHKTERPRKKAFKTYEVDLIEAPVSTISDSPKWKQEKIRKIISEIIGKNHHITRYAAIIKRYFTIKETSDLLLFLISK